ncbi:MAG: hypothetical protein JOY92_01235 [Verrucomicrobia bacterium]|nr:hypothetical protein [Verrucomicrobiota bacterium]
MSSEAQHYYEVILDEPSVYWVEELAGRDPGSAGEVPRSGREIQVIVGSPSKVADATVVQFAKELTKPLRLGRGWRDVNATVQPLQSHDLPPLGIPSHTEGNLAAWIVE